MKRRQFITLLGGAAAAWPLVARAQQPPPKVRRIGVLTNLASDDPESLTRIGAFLQGLQELGWTDGRNVRIDYRWGAGDPERNAKYAAELIALDPAVILATGLPTVEPLMRATRTAPIALAAQHRLPAVYALRPFVTTGGLISYGPDSIEPYRGAASYVDRILKGEKPADLPVQTPTKYDLVLNLKTAKALGLEIPPALIARADEVIE
jgi:ABC-type uncharacterized transport system substrate-binding protein